MKTKNKLKYRNKLFEWWEGLKDDYGRSFYYVHLKRKLIFRGYAEFGVSQRLIKDSIDEFYDRYGGKL